MVASPDSEIEPTLINGTGLTPINNNRNNNVSEANNANVGRIRDQVFNIPRVTIPNDKDNYTLKFDNTDKKQNVDINPEPVFVKKVAGKKSHEINTRGHACIYVHAIKC